MIGMDCINQQTAQDRDCAHCIWHTDGRCASWDFEYISRAEALEALEKVKNATPMVLPPEQPEIVRCKDCKYFEYDHPCMIQGVPVLGHLVCIKWGNGCRTDEDGFCFMGERKDG